MSEHLLQIEDLHLSFPNVNAINGISFHIDHNEVVGLIGESGCGKSLTAQSLLQLWPNGPHTRSGKVIYKGENLWSLSEKEMQKIRGKEISLILQDPSTSLNPTMRLGSQLTEGLRHHYKMGKEEAVHHALEWLRKVGIGDASNRMKQYPHELSGGMKQRIIIAMAMACKPSLLIADEPTTALDVTIQAQILELFKILRKEHRTSILLITHDLGVVARCCDRVLVMHKGQIIESAPVDLLFASPQHPYTKSLLRSKRSLTDGTDELYTGVTTF